MGAEDSLREDADGLIRSGFVIDRDGTVAAAKVNVNADKHREWALAELAKLHAPAAS